MQTQRKHRHDIKERDPPDPEARDDVRVNVLTAEHTSGSDVTGREMKDVDNDENQQQRSAPPHRSRGYRGDLGLTFRVPDRARRAALARELDRSYPAKSYGNAEHGAETPQQPAGAVEKRRVRVERGRAAEYEKIAERVDDDETNSD